MLIVARSRLLLSLTREQWQRKQQQQRGDDEDDEEDEQQDGRQLKKLVIVSSLSYPSHSDLLTTWTRIVRAVAWWTTEPSTSSRVWKRR